MLGEIHEFLKKEFQFAFQAKLAAMGISRDGLTNVANATFKGNVNGKEADMAFRPDKDSAGEERFWPTLAIECAVSESRKRLKVDACWWFGNSNPPEDVKIVLLFYACRVSRRIRIEKWEMRNVPNPSPTRAYSGDERPSPTNIHEVDIIGGSVTGAPLILEFGKIFLRQPDPGQGDIIFTEHDLVAYATEVRKVMQ